MALVSMFSLKKHNPDAEIILDTDKDTMETLNDDRGRLKQYVDEIKIADLPADMPEMQKSRFVKTTLVTYIKGDFLYLDVDTIILRNLEEIPALCQKSIAAVSHAHKGSAMTGFRSRFIKITGKEIWDGKIYFNGGVRGIGWRGRCRGTRRLRLRGRHLLQCRLGAALHRRCGGCR